MRPGSNRFQPGSTDQEIRNTAKFLDIIMFRTIELAVLMSISFAGAHEMRHAVKFDPAECDGRQLMVVE